MAIHPSGLTELKSRIVTDDRLDNKGPVKTQQTFDPFLSSAVNAKAEMFGRMGEQLRRALDKEVPACADCQHIGLRTEEMQNASSLNVTIFVQASCKVARDTRSMSCPKRRVYESADEPEDWAPPHLPPKEPIKPDQPQTTADAW